MLRLSKLTDYAVVVMVELSRQVGCDGGVSTSPRLAQATAIPEPTVAKVLKALASAGLVASQRGARGGYRLSRALSEVAVSDVIAAVDGPISMTACVDGATGGCEAQQGCPIRGRWDVVNDAIRDTLGRITLDSMDRDPVPHQIPTAGELNAVSTQFNDRRGVSSAAFAAE